MDIKPLTIVFIILLGLSFSGHSIEMHLTSDQNPVYETLASSKDRFDELCPISIQKQGYSIDERTVAACSMSTKAKPRAGRPISSNNKLKAPRYSLWVAG